MMRKVKKIIVDKEGDVKTLKEALEMAEVGTIIKICEGYYQTNVVINIPGIRIEPREKDKPVYLLGSDGPVITVDLQPGETCVIKHMIIVHSGSNISSKFKEQLDQSLILKASPKFLKEFDIGRNMDTIILQTGGNLIIRNCLLSLKSLPKNIKSYIPSIVTFPKCRINIVSSEFRGNETIMTAGCIFMNTDVLMSFCKLNNYKGGGILMSGKNSTNIKINDSSISKCGIVGIYAQGEDCRPMLLRVNVDNIDGPGIRIHKGNRCKVKGCTVVKCQMGIEVICADPFIIMNTIKQNYENGIVTVAKKDLSCDGIIKYNDVLKNKDNGIFCSGEKNFTKIIKNRSISNNRRAGIKAIEGAHISII